MVYPAVYVCSVCSMAFSLQACQRCNICILPGQHDRYISTLQFMCAVYALWPSHWACQPCNVCTLPGQHGRYISTLPGTELRLGQTCGLHIVGAAEGGAARDEVDQRRRHGPVGVPSPLRAARRPPAPPRAEPHAVHQPAILERARLLQACAPKYKSPPRTQLGVQEPPERAPPPLALCAHMCIQIKVQSRTQLGVQEPEQVSRTSPSSSGPAAMKIPFVGLWRATLRSLTLM